MKVYIVLEDWKIDSGESAIYNSVFSTFEKALKYYNHLKMNYEIDYETNNRTDEANIVEELDIDKKIADIKVIFKNSADYYKILIEEKEIDIGMEE